MTRPNIILIVADDLGYGDLGCYGSSLHDTPRLDRFAAEGARFTDFYAAASVCSPSRAALMTGCYPRRVGLEQGHNGRSVLFPGDPIGLHPGETTIGDALRRAGYATALIGKWHLGDQSPFLPGNHGFDRYFGLPYSNDMQPAHPLNTRHQFPPLPLLHHNEVLEADPNQVTLTDRYLVESIEFIRGQAAAERPFFLCLSHMYVHVPLHVPHRFMAASRNGNYGAAVAHLDATTGVILDTLADLGIDEETLVVFTSDNGCNPRHGGSNAPLSGGKGSTREGGMRMPCLARWPGTIPSGTTCAALTTMMDLLPTFASLGGAGLPDDPAIDGRDLSPLLRDPGTAASPHESFAYYSTKGELAGIRRGKWKLDLRSGELYDLEIDAAETCDRSAENPKIVDEIEVLAERYRNDLGCEASNADGCGRRPAGRCPDPSPLVAGHYWHPALRALYDIEEPDL